jgi:hypothetical protein
VGQSGCNLYSRLVFCNHLGTETRNRTRVETHMNQTLSPEFHVSKKKNYMKSKAVLLTTLLTIGFTFQNCITECDCPPIEGRFFDIKGIALSNMPSKAQVDFDNYFGINMAYQVDFITTIYEKNQPWNFSLMNTALACDCAFNGMRGSKNEKLDNVTVITLNDFDSEHLANDTINDLMLVRVGEFNLVDLNQYLQQDSMLIPRVNLELGLMLKKAPELNKSFEVKIIVDLSTTETYEATSQPITFDN